MGGTNMYSKDIMFLKILQEKISKRNEKGRSIKDNRNNVNSPSSNNSAITHFGRNHNKHCI